MPLMALQLAVIEKPHSSSLAAYLWILHYVQEILSINLEMWVRGEVSAPLRFQVIKQLVINWLHGAYMAERGFNPGTAASISIVLHVRGAAKLEGWSANSSQQKNVPLFPL